MSLKSRFYTLKSREQLDAEWLDFDRFAADLGEDRPHWYLARHNPRQQHGPHNTYWSRRPPSTARGCNALKDYRGWRKDYLKGLLWLPPARDIPEHFRLPSDMPRRQWLLVCNCGRLRLASPDHFRKISSCGRCEPLPSADAGVYTSRSSRDDLSIRVALSIGFKGLQQGTELPVVEPYEGGDSPAPAPPGGRGSHMAILEDSLDHLGGTGINCLSHAEASAVRARQGLDVTFQ